MGDEYSRGLSEHVIRPSKQTAIPGARMRYGHAIFPQNDSERRKYVLYFRKRKRERQSPVGYKFVFPAMKPLNFLKANTYFGCNFSPVELDT